jgi:DNA-binding MarR family transcriptional regulator
MVTPRDEVAPLRANERIGFLLKHAHERWLALHSNALQPYGINGRQLAVLLVVDSADRPSQQDAASLLGVDRTTMVGLIDELEGLGLIERKADATDRRRNLVALTSLGSATLGKARAASDAAEESFLAPLSTDESQRWRSALLALTKEEET